MAKTNISWATDVWNPVVGCTRVSPGCLNCYASTLHNRRYKANVKAALAEGHPQRQHGGTIAQFARAGGVVDLPMPPQYDVPFAKVQLMPQRLDQPLRWKKSRRIFVNSVSDLFHEDVPDSFIGAVFAVMSATPDHTYQILTKRPERMRDFVRWDEAPINHGAILEWMPEETANKYGCGSSFEPEGWPLPNVWLGVSVEDQRHADERIPLLLDTPAAVRFISAEPLLSAVDLTRIQYVAPESPHGPGVWVDALTSYVVGPDEYLPGRPTLSWVIVGGESGKGWRPMDHEWARTLREQCRTAGVAYFGKQDSAYHNEVPLPGALGDQEWP